MYHVANDKRAKQSVELISKGLQQALENNNFKNLSITNITKQAGVGRATFYRLFDSKDDIIQYQVDTIFSEITEYMAENLTDNLSNFVIRNLNIWFMHPETIQVLIKTDRLNLVIQAVNRNAEEFKRVIFPDRNISDLTLDYGITITANMLAAGLKVWDEHGRTESAEDVLKQVIQVFHLIQEEL